MLETLQERQLEWQLSLQQRESVEFKLYVDLQWSQVLDTLQDKQFSGQESLQQSESVEFKW